MGKRCVTMRRIASSSPICDATNIHRSAVENVPKITVLRALWDAMRPESIISQIRDREVNLCTALHLLCINYFLVRWTPKFLIADEIVVLRVRKMTDKWPKIPSQLRIWIFIVPKSNVCEKDGKVCVDQPPGLEFLIWWIPDPSHLTTR